MTTPRAYLDELSELLPPSLRHEARADLTAAFDDGLRPEDLPAPAEYARELMSGRADDDPRGTATEPLTRVLGMPADVRGLTDAHVLSRAFDPTNPDLLVPRTMGIGWDINFGAVAVKLGLLRPDDVDEDVIAAIPTWARRGVQAATAGLALTTAGAVCLALRHSDAARLPFAFEANGAPRSFGPRRATALGLTGAAAALAAWGVTAPRENPMRAALALGLSTLPAGQAALLAGWSRDPERRRPVAALLLGLGPVVGTLTAAVLPIRAGLRRVSTVPGR